MAEGKKYENKVSEVETLVARRVVLSLGDVMEKFSGRHTARTLAAARRIRAKPRTIKIPRNLLRQLFWIIGGWYTDPAQRRVGSVENDPNFEKKATRVITLGELEAVSKYDSRGRIEGSMYLRYRGVWVGYINYPLDPQKLRGAFEALGVPFDVNS